MTFVHESKVLCSVLYPHISSIVVLPDRRSLLKLTPAAGPVLAVATLAGRLADLDHADRVLHEPVSFV
jgi:hypothetical protein